jgi:uncharacterized protein YggE
LGVKKSSNWILALRFGGITVQQFSKASPLTIAVVVGFVIVTVVALTLGVTSLARASNLAAVPAASQLTGIAVCGHGVGRVQPDQAQVQVGVQTTAANAEDARAQAAQAMTAVLAALKKNGVDDKDIQTGYLSIQPVYDYSAGKQQQTGYLAYNSVTVTIRKVDNVGAVVDAVTQAGGNHVVVNGVQFSASDPSQAQDEAVQNALADARRQAQKVAAASGVSVGTPISIQVGSCGQSSTPQVAFADKGAANGSSGSPPTPIQPGQQQVDAYVGVVFAIK